MFIVNDNIRILPLVLFLLCCSITGVNNCFIFKVEHSENTTNTFSDPTSIILHLPYNFQETGIQSPNISKIILSQVVVYFEVWWKYILFMILFLQVLWFYRRYEIRKIERQNRNETQKPESGFTSEDFNYKSIPHSGKEETVDQCLTGMCDKRFCFFNLNGNRIHIEDDGTTVFKPASIEMLLHKINANKFCDRVCQENDNRKFPAGKFFDPESNSGQNHLPEFKNYELLYKSYDHSNGLNYSSDLIIKNETKPLIFLKEASVSPLDMEFFLDVFKVIDSNYTDYRFSVELLALEINMSVSQLNRKLNVLTGFPAGRLVSKYRLQCASDFLIQKADSISDVCFSTGYNGLAYFSRAFKREFGCSPSVFRQLMTKKSISVRN